MTSPTHVKSFQEVSLLTMELQLLHQEVKIELIIVNICILCMCMCMCMIFCFLVKYIFPNQRNNKNNSIISE